MAKKVLLIVIDALAPGALLPAMAEGRLPTFQALADRGSIHPECCSIFPSITHACLASIATGEYPLEHGIVGSFWYEQEKKEIAYYGAQYWMILNQGLSKFLEDLTFKMNMERLKAPTIFQRLEAAGKSTASLNHLIFRGDHRYPVCLPKSVELVRGISSDHTLCGPSTFFLGDFVPLKIKGEEMEIEGGLAQRFGMTDQGTIEALWHLADKEAMPDLTVAYFPENDVESHARGPQQAVEVLETLDSNLAILIAKLGGLDAMLADFAIIIHGDHSQIPMLPGSADGGIQTEALLKEFDVIVNGEPLESPDQILIAPNLRTLFIYFGAPTLDRRRRLEAALFADERIDQLFWRSDAFEPDSPGFVVATKDRGRLRFWADDAMCSGISSHCAKDDYGANWRWEGDLRAVDARVIDGRLVWADYPNAFERIACGIGPTHAGHVWATARPGHGFRVPHVKAHEGGGSHASLYRGDSYTALLTAGFPETVHVPERPRIVDTFHMVLRLLEQEENGLSTPRYRP